MNYNKIYNNLLEKAKKENHKKDVYYENHHIIPRCIGGGDNKTNLIKLLPEQHFLAHLLLAKIYNDNPKLWYSCNLMRRIGNNKKYSFVRKRISKNVKDRWAKKHGYNDYSDQCEKIWQYFYYDKMTVNQIFEITNLPHDNINRSLKYYSIKFDLSNKLKERRFEIKSNNSKLARMNDTEETRKNRIEKSRNFDYTERNIKMSKDRMGKNNPVYGKTWKHKKEKCPHCNKLTASKRWHFDNCRSK